MNWRNNFVFFFEKIEMFKCSNVQMFKIGGLSFSLEF